MPQTTIKQKNPIFPFGGRSQFYARVVTTARSSISVGDADMDRIATLIGDRARARVLMALADGRALPASRLAAEARRRRVHPQRAPRPLIDGQLLTAE